MDVNLKLDYNSKGLLKTIIGIDELKDKVLMYLFTNPGDRVGNPLYGYGIELKLFTDEFAIDTDFSELSNILSSKFGENINVQVLQKTQDTVILVINFVDRSKVFSWELRS